MSQTLLIEGNEQRGSMLSLNLQVYTGTNVIWKESIAEAIEVLGVLPQVNLILALDDQAGSIDSLLQCLEESNLNVPVISSSHHAKGELLKPIKDGFDLTELINLASKNLGVSQNDIVKKVLPDFFPISIDSFKFENEIVCDVFIKLKRPDGTSRFVKRMNAGDTLDAETIHRYIMKSVDKLYVLKEDRFKFTDSFSNHIIAKLKSENGGISEKLNLVNSARDVIQIIFNSDEISERDVELIEQSINSMEDVCKKSQKLSDLLADLLASKSSYRYQLVTVTAFLGLKALKKMNYPSITVMEAQIQKFMQACFLHDILLSDDDQAKVRSEEDIETLQVVEKDLVLTHALKTSEMVKSLPNILDEVPRIILEHHGKPTGSGFSFDFLQRLHPLALVLIACENYAHEILSYSGKSFNYDDIVKKLPPIFLKKEFWKVISNIG